MKTSSAKAKCRRCEDLYPKRKGQRICDSCRSKCSSCEVVLTEDNQDQSSLKYRSNYTCKVCVSKTVKKSRGNAGFNQKEYDLKRNYGLTPEQFSRLPEECEICGSTERLVVDHCHTTGKVRGRLCSKCNTGLGMFKDSFEILRKALDYANEKCKK